jgi:dihydroneopterin aldolase
MAIHHIEVNEIRLYAHHGCLTEEGKIGQEYLVDVLISTDFSLSTNTDDISHTVDYVWINKLVEEEMAIRSKLIEHVGQRIVNKLLSHNSITTARVKITKPAPPLNGDVKNVAIIIEQEHSNK